MRFLRAPAERSALRVPLSRIPEIARLADRVRTETAVHLRSEVKSQMRKLREQLPLDDQTLLILRVDKDLAWEDVATVLASTDAPLGPDELTRETARVRKRFQLVKEKLKRMAEQAGLL
jgi:RNA polymerase sigma-70 factor (ECF subfamily)